MTAPACPTCGKPAVEGFRPFCSRRCADVDLQRWLVGAYAIPASEDDDGNDAGDEDDKETK
jgi:uncharacterized protein